MSDLSGRTTLVVGASRGLGRGIARAFAEAGASVVAVARTGPALAELATTSANIRSDMVRLVDQLEQLGQVVRHRDRADRRRHLLTLTPAGRRALSRGKRVIERVTDDMLSNLSGAERRALHRLALRALGEPPDLADDAPGGPNAAPP